MSDTFFPVLSVALLGPILSSGCEDVRHDYFPLEVGSRWTYRVISGAGPHRPDVRPAGDRVHEPESIEVIERVEYSWEDEGGNRDARASADGRGPVGSTTLSGRRGPVGSAASSGRGGRRTERFKVREPAAVAIWTKNEGGVFRIVAGAVTTIIQYPPFVGFGWTDEGPLVAGRRALVYCKVVGREHVRTPAGWFFDCVTVEREAQDFSSVVRQWFAPEVGLVKWRVERPGRPTVEWLLEEYRAGRGPVGAARQERPGGEARE